MRLRNITGSREMIAANDYVVQRPEDYRGHWAESCFHHGERPLHIEIGAGKGRFLTTMAQLHPQVSYLGLEKYSSVLLRAVQKMEEEPWPNLLFLRMDAEYVTEVFAEDEVARIYLNFSDPWPKDRHAKRRLPSREFLARYERILAPQGEVEFKTDNRALFDFAIEEAAARGWERVALTYDLHQDEALMRGNVMTEYEERFSLEGHPICKYIIRRP